MASSSSAWSPNDEPTAVEIVAAYPDLAHRNDTEIVIKSSGEAFAEALLSRFGGRIRRFIVEDPTLESVFLSLTGRELRDAPASARERTFQFGRRGGEHTR